MPKEHLENEGLHFYIFCIFEWSCVKYGYFLWTYTETDTGLHLAVCTFLKLENKIEVC